jgi:phosphoglycerate dehydrogenase-like enzyme
VGVTTGLPGRRRRARTPHAGGFIDASVRRATVQAVENLLAVLTDVPA